MKNTILEIPIKDIIADESLSGRTRKEITDNAKTLIPRITAHGGWDASQPGKVFKRGDKWHLAAGFSRRVACEGITKTGFFCEVEDDIATLRTEAIRSNGGRAISAREQGRIYAGMRDGNAETAKKGDTILAPMKSDEIAKTVGYSRQWIDACLGIYEETPEIAALIENEEVTSGAINRARQIAKKEDKTPDDSGRLKLLKAAIKHAQSDGRPRAAEDDVNAVRHDLFPIKADAPKLGKPAKKKKAESASKDNAADTEEKEQGEAPATNGDLFGDNSVTVPPKVAKKAKEIALEIFSQCGIKEDRATEIITALNAAGVQLSLSAL